MYAQKKAFHEAAEHDRRLAQGPGG
jgi:hypothetical protein